jgi:ABC-type transporter Mla maintaining outer membrane lipid asymmetry permease subunit MlaE
VGLGAASIAILDAIMRPNAIAAHLHSVVAYAITRELIPLAVTAALALRSAPAIAVDLASQSSPENEMPRARRRSILFKNALSLALSAVGLVVWMSAAALVGGFLVVSFAGLAPVGLRLSDILAEISPGTITAALSKAALAGAAVGFASAHAGLVNASNAPRAAARAGSIGLFGGVAINLAISIAPLAGL